MSDIVFGSDLDMPVYEDEVDVELSDEEVEKPKEEKKKKKKKKLLPGEEPPEGEMEGLKLEEGEEGDKKKKKKQVVVAGNTEPAPPEEIAELEEDAVRVQVDTSHLQCRFYESQFPDAEALVMVNVRHIAEMGAYVSLLEYNNIEGMILLSELSRRRIRSINKLIRVNRNEVVMVLRVDKEKGYIDLSKRRVSPEDIAKCEDRFNKAKAVHSVLRHLADQRKLNLEALYRQIGWPLYAKYGHAYDAFKMTLQPAEGAEDPFEPLELEEDLKVDLLKYIKRRLAPQPIKVRADVEVSCFSYEGIDAIRAALKEGIKLGSQEQGEIKIRLIAPPIYVMSVMTLDKDFGIDLLSRAISVIEASILAANGKMEIKMAPKAVSLREETELQAMMDRLAAENEEVDGDEPEDDGEN